MLKIISKARIFFCTGPPPPEEFSQREKKLPLGYQRKENCSGGGGPVQSLSFSKCQGGPS